MKLHTEKGEVIINSDVFTTITGAAKIDKLQLNTAGIRINVVNLTTGADVQFSFLGSVCHVFSKETGINLEA